MAEIHKPVLLKEVMGLLNLKEGSVAIDATLDGGGHTMAILKKVGKSGKVLGIDQDSEILKQLKISSQAFTSALGNFREIDQIAQSNGFEKADAILFDLGVSTWHFTSSMRGFSFGKPKEPLIMRLGGGSKTAAEILNSYTEQELADIFAKYGEIKHPYGLAKKVINARKEKRIVAVDDLLTALGIKDKKELARIFQALRIAVNDEMAALREALTKSFEILKNEGRLAVISYHSLEDRITKEFFKSKTQEGFAKVITRKPVYPTEEEVLYNPSARSARLRVIKKI